MGSVAQIIELADKQVGNNGEKYWNWYTDNINPRQGYYVNGYRTPYCAEYISWLLRMTNTECIYFPHSQAFDGSDIHPSDRISKYALKPGDILAYDWDDDYSGDHVGVVKRIYSYGVEANEGNVSDKVANVTRYFDDILFGIRPKYSDSSIVVKLKIDGIFGTITASAVQEILKDAGFYYREIDGDFGYYSKVGLQMYLKKKGFYTETAMRKLGYYGIACIVDGDFRYYSNCALQLYLKDIGYYTREHMNKLGYNNIACVIDGDWGFYTTVAIQSAINDNKF